ncbi:calcium/sodium antiporter [Urbifossiella limnaea]|uniref:Inner membrane protein YrbG n=1 Tax=Urbifossiella limnaea TaxID=2528023 RepID=A0A517XTL5_9BACT|nr:calcium/sodium antiporter [Urbifossiella limnaea]QDU20838.1 Inner membrane protein YrbG [Urbifossiella limnaea]
MLTHLLLFVVGLAVLGTGAEWLVRGAGRVARALGVPPFVVGFTVVGFGTSAPELVVSLSAALADTPEIAVGNVIGSNVANVGLVLGVAAVVAPLAAGMRLLKVEVPSVIGASLLLWVLSCDGRVGRADGGVLLLGFAGAAVYMYRVARAEPPAVKAEIGQAVAGQLRVSVAAVLVVAGLGGLIGGAHLMVTAAVELARGLGVSEWLIGLTVVAVGTSLPELAACIAGAIRGEADLVLGNVAGSNLFNILLILGTTALVRPVPVPAAALTAELPVMTGFAVLLLAVVGNGLRVHRWEGAGLVAAYAGFVAWQVSRT